ncbi:Phytosulfokine receptor 1 [Camellia lanceoleosa]|uniref:Phytosulfokine receptor 1 n=1 Tax=Camellia lanceoleosa TaxID=1840588 RepID=A0ACC0G7G6_9ERIC|nr:Phytosulfokine receptor 1 [Camellia lanceoleosa]
MPEKEKTTTEAAVAMERRATSTAVFIHVQSMRPKLPNMGQERGSTKQRSAVRVSNFQNLTCNSNDLKALEAFMIGLDSGTINGWGTSNCQNRSESPQFIFSLWFLQRSYRFRRVVKLNSGKILAGKLNQTTFTGLDQLRTLNLSINFLGGSLPQSLFQLPNLQVIDLSKNDFSGSIPMSINLPFLEIFDISANSFESSVLVGICINSTRIRIIDFAVSYISWNSFSGPIPDVFRGFAQLQDCFAESNNFSSRIPSSLANSRTITSLVLRNNFLNGVIDLNCSEMIRLVSLSLTGNQFTGPIPDNLPLCPRLKIIGLAGNYFTGQIAESFRNFHGLSWLSLSNSTIFNLSAALDILQHCENLTTLALTSSFHGEQLPSFPCVGFKNLKVCFINNCRLTGVFRQWLSGLTNLQLLDLSMNRLDGTIPPWLGNFEFLFYIDLSNNSFTGEIPKNLTRLECLISRDVLSEGPFLGFSFPFVIEQVTSVSWLQYNQIWRFPPTLNLGNNFLTGPIWPEFGNLKKLHSLDLKCNNLSRNILKDLSGMTSIEILDLSHNYLSGAIPFSLVNLSFLSKFNFAYNQLYVTIPTGGQFETFPNSSFEGNLGLRSGKLLSPFPISNQVPQVISPSKSMWGEIIVKMSFGMGFGIGFGTTVAVMFLFVLNKLTFFKK